MSCAAHSEHLDPSWSRGMVHDLFVTGVGKTVSLWTYTWLGQHLFHIWRGKPPTLCCPQRKTADAVGKMPSGPHYPPPPPPTHTDPVLSPKEDCRCWYWSPITPPHTYTHIQTDPVLSPKEDCRCWYRSPITPPHTYRLTLSCLQRKPADAGIGPPSPPPHTHTHTQHTLTLSCLQRKPADAGIGPPSPPPPPPPPTHTHTTHTDPVLSPKEACRCWYRSPITPPTHTHNTHWPCLVPKGSLQMLQGECLQVPHHLHP